MFKNSWFEKFAGNPPVSEGALAKFRSSCNILFPAEYESFLRIMNGGEGLIGESYIHLYKLEELLAMNRGYNFSEYSQGYFLFGSDGGGEAFAFDLRSEARPVLMIPFVGDVADAVMVGAGFLSFLQRIATPGFNPITSLRQSSD